MIDENESQKYAELRAIVARLRAPDGCPWDREQTHASLRPFLIQEAYEVLALLDEGDTQRLPEEMGDLLFQILLHTQLAEEAGEFTMADVLGSLAGKLVRRHPHVFGDVKLETADQVVDQWDDLKRAERPPEQSALAGVPKAMPALSLAQELLDRAARAGFAWPRREDVLDKLTEEVRELDAAATPDERLEEFGDLLLNLVNYARYLGIDSEEALRLASTKFRRRFEVVEAQTRDEGRALSEMSRSELLERWERAKAQE
jgi:tetrapyrrole methylase family protein/MazG family protein